MGLFKKNVEDVPIIDEHPEITLTYFKQQAIANQTAYNTKMISKKEYERTKEFIRQNAIKHQRDNWTKAESEDL